VYARGDGFVDKPITVTCGDCRSCRLEYARTWGVRGLLELQDHDRASFITLTFRDEDLPVDGSLDVKHWQRFHARFRKHHGPARYIAAGEYGADEDDRRRPHYHAILYGHHFPDRYPVDTNELGQVIYRSPLLEERWGQGAAYVGDVTFESIGYVARYTMKKQRGKGTPDGWTPHDHYTWHTRPNSMVVETVKPEFMVTSRRPGIGRAWFDKWKNDVYPHDELIVNGRPQRPPKYFDRLMEQHEPDAWRRIRVARQLKAEASIDQGRKFNRERRRRTRNTEHSSDDHERHPLTVLEQVLERRLSRLDRNRG
jgi:hypothetical protein